MQPGLSNDWPALQALATELGGGQLCGLRRLSGGASQETWAFDLQQPSELQALVLRRARPGRPAGDGLGASLAAEFALLDAAAKAGVPVPRTRLLLRPEHGLGEGFVMQRLTGETLGRRIVADERFAAARAGLARACGQALARIHAIPGSALPGLPALPALPIASAAEAVAHHQRWHASHATLRPTFDLALQWLRGHLPAACKPTLVHGDFRNGNLMVDEHGLVGVLDWELAHLGDPMADLAWLCVNSWRYGRSDLPVGGFGQRSDLYAGYVDAGGPLDESRLHFWAVLGTLKWGVICDSMAQSWLDGHDRSVERAAIGRRANETELDLLELLAPRADSRLAQRA